MSNGTKRIATIRLDSIKDPDGWGNLLQELEIDDEKRNAHFKWGEYASLELTIEAAMRWSKDDD